MTTVNKASFVMQNPAKDMRDKVILMYDEFICLKIKDEMTLYEKDQACRRFLRKIATHSLNSLQDGREDFM